MPKELSAVDMVPQKAVIVPNTVYCSQVIFQTSVGGKATVACHISLSSAYMAGKELSATGQHETISIHDISGVPELVSAYNAVLAAVDVLNKTMKVL